MLPTRFVLWPQAERADVCVRAPCAAAFNAAQVHERIDVDSTCSGRHTTSQKVLASQYADIYFGRLNKVPECLLFHFHA